MNIKQRKVWSQGKSKAVALPPDWIRFHNPDEVEMIWNGAIVIIAKGTPKEERDRLITALQG